ncbi:DUF3194 domain-containing protein [Candidatus Thorarchaeota archaeon]|nr:MAG: DUF3194 domain-containing protein [Candidatus Thorarchaeota archaeon]
MKPPVDVGLPSLDFNEMEVLAEKCEEEITGFIFQRIPEKSIEEMTVSCTLEMNEQLNLEIQIEINQKYHTGHDLENIIEEAAEHGSDWLEERLREMKAN